MTAGTFLGLYFLLSATFLPGLAPGAAGPAAAGLLVWTFCYKAGLQAPGEEMLFRGEAKMAKHGPIVATTGKHTGRSANDKFVVREASTAEHIWWGQYNRPFSPDKFNELTRA